MTLALWRIFCHLKESNLEEKMFKYILLLVIIFLFSSCTSSEEILISEHELISHPNTVLLHEQRFVSAPATGGGCAATWVDRWYGSEIKIEDEEKLKNSFDEQMKNNEWIYEEGEWHKETDDGLFGARIILYASEDNFKPILYQYALPQSLVSQSFDYPHIYLFGMNNTTPAAMKRCPIFQDAK